MALQVAQLDSFRVRRHNASAGQQGAMDPRLGFADVVPLAALHASAQLVDMKNTRRPGSKAQNLDGIMFLADAIEHFLLQILQIRSQSRTGL